MNGDLRAVQVKITGRVQGVSFRDWTREEASRLGLKGWVRNERDGSVTALIAGSGDAVTTMLEHFWEGPRLASVSEVKTDAVTISEAPTDFRITG